ncbi:Inhibitor of growth protein 3 [Dictyocoela muelleri]|nr:Inhibitor of growth protein 3 [Dictyocoela muelleri]
MLYHEALNSLIEIQKRVQKTITKIKEPLFKSLKEVNVKNKNNKESINTKDKESINTKDKKLILDDKEIDIFENPSMINFLLAQKKDEEIETLLTILLKDLDLQIESVFVECKEFDSLVARTGLMAKNEKLTKKLVDENYCICNNSDEADMIACDDKNCSIEWFHLKCVGLTEAPKGKWFCDNCLFLRKNE